MKIVRVGGRREKGRDVPAGRGDDEPKRRSPELVAQTAEERMREAGAKVLAVEAGKTVLLDAELLFSGAAKLGFSVVGF